MGCNNREFDIVLVLPSFEGVKDLSLGLASIDSYLKSKGRNSVVINSNNVDAYIDKSEIFGFSILDHTHHIAREITSKLKDKTVIWGGATATSLPEYLLKENPALDYVILSEGEERLLQLLESFENPGVFDNIDGIAFRDSVGQIVIREAVTFMDMNDLPLSMNLVQLGDLIMVDMTRGCYGRCGYCQETFKMRFKSPENTVRDIAHWYEKGYRKFYLGNANSVANGKLLSDVIDLLEEKELEIQLCIVGRPNDYHRNIELIERIFRSKILKIHILEIGVESNSENGLKLLGRNIPKKINNEMMKRLLLFKEQYSPGTNVMANMILFPHFDMVLDDFIENVRFIGEYRCSRFTLSPRVIGLSNSAIWKEMRKKGFGAISDGLRIVQYNFTDPVVDKLYKKLKSEIDESIKKDNLENNSSVFMDRLHDKIIEFYESGNIEATVLEYVAYHRRECC